MHKCHKKISAVSLCLFLSLNSLFAAANPGMLFSQGEKALSLNDYANAASSFAQALKFEPQNLRARFRYGQALYSMNKFNESIEQFNIILNNSPNNIIARVHLVENLLKLRQNEEARRHLDWILQIQPGHPRALQLKNSGADNDIIPGPAPESKPVDIRPLEVRKIEEKAESETEVAITPFVSEKPAAKPRKTPAKTKQTARLVAAKADQVKVENIDPENFNETARNSFLLNLERARFNIEEGQITQAEEYLDNAEKLARKNRDERKFLEVQVLRSLVFMYALDFRSFGRHLVNLKPLMSKESYQSFLDMYNQGMAMKDTADLARLVAGIAMGARHHRIAGSLLQTALARYPEDPLIISFLAEAQMQSLDYSGAEKTLRLAAQKDPENPDTHFNLARFYLTADYRPEQALIHANYAQGLNPEDRRIDILMALIDYTRGNINAGIARINNFLPQVKDESLKAICEKIISDGQTAHNSKTASEFNFASLLALPGTPHAPADSFRMIGEDYLRQGSFFSALKYFSQANDLAEIGRTYLGLASALESSKETESAIVAAAYGLEALNRENSRNPDNGRAHLYLALYYFDLGDRVNAKKAVEKGLIGNTDRLTRQRLTSILDSINQS